MKKPRGIRRIGLDQWTDPFDGEELGILHVFTPRGKVEFQLDYDRAVALRDTMQFFIDVHHHRTPKKYYKQPDASGMYGVIDATMGKMVILDGCPLEGLEDHEAEEAAELLNAGTLEPDEEEESPQGDNVVQLRRDPQ